MAIILLMRHGVAEDRADWAGPESSRPLTEDGRAKVRTSCQQLFSVKPQWMPSLVISSLLVRSQQTAEIAKKTIVELTDKSPKQLETKTLNPGASFAQWQSFLLDEVFNKKAQKNDMPHVILAIGHEPSISTLVARHLGAKELLLDFRKGGVAIIETISEQDLTGQLVAFLPPRVIKSLGSKK